MLSWALAKSFGPCKLVRPASPLSAKPSVVGGPVGVLVAFRCVLRRVSLAASGRHRDESCTHLSIKETRQSALALSCSSCCAETMMCMGVEHNIAS